jgi:hypothetical protein
MKDVTETDPRIGRKASWRADREPAYARTDIPGDTLNTGVITGFQPNPPHGVIVMMRRDGDGKMVGIYACSAEQFVSGQCQWVNMA